MREETIASDNKDPANLGKKQLEEKEEMASFFQYLQYISISMCESVTHRRAKGKRLRCTRPRVFGCKEKEKYLYVIAGSMSFLFYLVIFLRRAQPANFRLGLFPF